VCCGQCEPAKRLRLVILDACRENPFVRSMKRTVATRSVGRGLARIEPSTPNTLIAYATKPNATAEDGEGPNSPFTAALVRHLLTPGLDLRIVLGNVRDEVMESTGNKQEPYVTSSVGGGTIAIVSGAPGPAAAISTPVHTPKKNERTHVMMVVFDTPRELHYAPVPESSCLFALREFERVGPYTLTLHVTGKNGNPELVTGTIIEIHCVTPEGQALRPRRGEATGRRH
jgi:hypothetical protein